MRYCRIPWGEVGATNVPCVASHACWRKTLSPLSLRMSRGMERRCAAKMQFIRGMYCEARSPETERRRMRELSGFGGDVELVVVVTGGRVEVLERRVCLEM